MLINCLIVGIGGFCGAICRYLLTVFAGNINFPFMTVIINITGSFIVGIIAGVSGGTMPWLSKEKVLFAQMGFCGSFTTLSTFSLETYKYIKNSGWLYGVGYCIISMIFCVLGVLCGQLLAGIICKK